MRLSHIPPGAFPKDNRKYSVFGKGVGKGVATLRSNFIRLFKEKSWSKLQNAECNSKKHFHTNTHSCLLNPLLNAL
jgi:hypothetical protein